MKKNHLFILFFVLIASALNAQNTTPVKGTVNDTIIDALFSHYDVTNLAGELILSASNNYSTSDIFAITAAIPPIVIAVVSNNPGMIPENIEKSFYTSCWAITGALAITSIVFRFLGHGKLSMAGEIMKGVKLTSNGVSIDL